MGVLQDNLVLSTELTMQIGHRKEIRKLTFRALSLRWSESCGFQCFLDVGRGRRLSYVACLEWLGTLKCLATGLDAFLCRLSLRREGVHWIKRTSCAANKGPREEGWKLFPILLCAAVVSHSGCLLFVGISRLGWPLNNDKGFNKISKPTERNGAYHLQLDFL